MATSSISAQIQTSADEYAATLTKSIDALQEKRDILSSKSTAYTSIRTKMAAMNLSAKSLANSSSSAKFSVYTVATTDAAVATATATAGNALGTHTLSVSQLAKNDMVMTSRVTNTDTTLSTAIGATTKQFQISVNGVNTPIEVTLDGTETNTAVFVKIAAAVNAKTSTSGVSASVVGDTTSTSKLVFTSKTTGTANAVVLSDLNGGNVLDAMGLTSAVLSGRTGSTSTTAGFSYSDSALLDSKFTLDGIEMTRSSNSVSDAITGMALTLKSTQLATASPVTLTVDLDAATIKTNVNDFLTKYNDLITVIRAQTAIDTTAKTRQVLSEDNTYVQLRSTLRMMVMGTVSSVSTGNPTSLSAIGITADATGKLSISDATKFTDALAKGSSTSISDLFNSSAGIAVKMKARMEDFVATNGVLDGNSKSVKERISAIDKKITEYKTRNAKKVERYKIELAKATATLATLSTQTQLATAYATQVSSSSS